MKLIIQNSNTTFVKVKLYTLCATMSSICYSNTTFVKVKCIISSAECILCFIQIQHLLKLNIHNNL